MINFTIYCFIIVIVNCSFCTANLTGHIVGGVYAKIEDFPHSAHLVIECYRTKNHHLRDGSNSEIKLRTKRAASSCGSAIIDQYFLLSAAHCLDKCYSVPRTFILVTVGSSNKRDGLNYRAEYFLRSEHYIREQLENDICLIKLYRPLEFSKYVKKVAIMQKPPYDEPGEIAGWGLIDDNGTRSDLLKSTMQNIYRRDECMYIIRYNIPHSTVCVGFKEPKGNDGYLKKGDSGSGLIVKKYILVGLVSYKLTGDDVKSISVFTDVGFFYEWITTTIERLYCSSDDTVNVVIAGSGELQNKKKKGKWILPTLWH